jgi:hypothetical protein
MRGTLAHSHYQIDAVYHSHVNFSIKSRRDGGRRLFTPLHYGEAGATILKLNLDGASKSSFEAVWPVVCRKLIWIAKL